MWIIGTTQTFVEYVSLVFILIIRPVLSKYRYYQYRNQEKEEEQQKNNAMRYTRQCMTFIQKFLNVVSGFILILWFLAIIYTIGGLHRIWGQPDDFSRIYRNAASDNIV